MQYEYLSCSIRIWLKYLFKISVLIMDDDNDSSAFAIDYRNAPALALAHSRSIAILAAARTGLSEAALDCIETVAVGGSLGRLEASGSADFDCIVVARDDACPVALDRDVARIHDVLASCGLRRPKADGIYRDAITPAALLDQRGLGSLDETPTIFGKRMQFLLDARPVFAPVRFAALRHAILCWYGSGFFGRDGALSWTYLLNDVQRYLHAYAGWQQYKLARTVDDSWELRQAKFRSSRVVTFAGLLALLGASNHRVDKIDWLAAHLDATPLERLGQVMWRHDPAAFDEALANYEFVHARLADAAFRAELVAGGPDESTGFGAAPSPAFASIDRTTSALMELLSGFLIGRWGHWDKRFFARLLL